MTQRSSIFGSVGGDRVYDPAVFARAWQRLISTGVVDGDGNNLNVIQNTPAAMNVKVDLGSAFILGYFFEVYGAAEVVTIAAANPTNPRIDRVVIRRDLAARTMSLAVVQGVAASSPAVPALTQNTAGVYEISLAQVRVNAAATSIVTANITDERIYGAAELGSVFSPTTGHKHDGTDSRKVTYADLLSIPASFAPAAHAHSVGSTPGQVPYANLSGIPATFNPNAHDHAAASTEGQVPFANITGIFDPVNNPVTQAIGDAAAGGASGYAAHRDHKHGMPAFGAVTAETAFGGAAANGVAATVSRSDHAHGNPAAPTATSLGAPLAFDSPATADGGKRIYVGTAAPTGMVEGDVWIKG